MASDLRVQAQLIVAIFELKAVKSIRDAVRVNTLKKGGREGPLGNIDNPKPPPSLPNFGEQRYGTVDLDAAPTRVEVRRAVESTCGCIGQRVPHATLAPAPRLPDLIPTDVTLPATDAERASGLPSVHASPLAPPWALPLPIPPRVTLVKWCRRPVDPLGKGSMLDCFC